MLGDLRLQLFHASRKSRKQRAFRQALLEERVALALRLGELQLQFADQLVDGGRSLLGAQLATAGLHRGQRAARLGQLPFRFLNIVAERADLIRADLVRIFVDVRLGRGKDAIAEPDDILGRARLDVERQNAFLDIDGDADAPFEIFEVLIIQTGGALKPR